MFLKSLQTPRPVVIPEQNIKNSSHVDESCLSLFPFLDIPLIAFPPDIRRLDLSYMNQIYSGIGIHNKNGGMEFYHPRYSQHPVTVGSFGYTYIPRTKGIRSNTCCIFSDFLDYLAFSIMQMYYPVNLPVHTDILIVNHHCNFISAMLVSDEYDFIYCYFKHDVLSRVMSTTLVDRNKRCEDRSAFYSKFDSLFNYIKSYRPKDI